MLSREKKKLAVLYVYADKKRYPNTFNYLSSLIKRINGFEITVVKIDNFNENKGVRRLSDSRYDIGGDNTYWEFSGWKKGLSFLKEQDIEVDWVLFVNDSFLSLPNLGYHLDFYKVRINTLLLYNMEDAVVGVIDTSMENHELLGRNVSTWIRSNLFAVPWRIAKTLEFTFLDSSQIDAIFPKAFKSEIFLEGNNLNSNLKRFLAKWITQDWHGGRSPAPDNWDHLRAKLIAILNERLLTAKIRESGVPIVDLAGVRPTQVCITGLRYLPFA